VYDSASHIIPRSGTTNRARTDYSNGPRKIDLKVQNSQDWYRMVRVEFNGHLTQMVAAARYPPPDSQRLGKIYLRAQSLHFSF
jgi:hypothetical protein